MQVFFIDFIELDIYLNCIYLHSMKILFLFLVFIISISVNAKADPVKYTSNIATQVFEILTNSKIPVEKQKRILVDKFISEIDFEWNARAVSGQFWKKMTDDQKGSFVDSYKQFLIRTWLNKFKGYDNQKYHISDKYQTLDNNDNIVNMNILTKENKNINISLRLRKKEDSYKILNVIAEGVDMARTYNMQFTDYMDKYGIDECIKYLKTGKIKQ